MEKQNKQKERFPYHCPFCLGTGKSLKELTKIEIPEGGTLSIEHENKC